MSTPIVTVLMPVYNAERFLARAIQSILDQTFTDFELLIINDGSTDKSVAIIDSFKDERIRLIHNETNVGVIDTLNKGLLLAKGKYIARMDADDICLPQRFEKQVLYLDTNPEVVVVASHITQIDADEDDLGHWVHDIQTVTPSSIAQSTAKTNCIAHPSVMMQTSVIRSYKYNTKQKGSEDWDLWMRLISDGKQIHKIPETLLLYRLHQSSVTALHNKTMKLETKMNRVKINFLKGQLRNFKIGKFELWVLLAIFRTLARDIKINRIPLWLRFWKHILTISPFKAYQEFLLLKKAVKAHPTNSGLFFFFPYTHVGGAEKVHALITETVKDKQPFIFFTGFSQNKKFLPLFKNNGVLLDVPLAINHPFFKKQAMSLIVACIEHHSKPVVFGCNNRFFYDLISHLSSSVKIIELMHDFRYDGEEWVSKPLLPLFMRCDKRVFISERALSQTKKFYKANSVEPSYLDRLLYIPNYVSIPDTFIPKNKKEDEALSILYVGRGTAEKRANLVLEIAKKCFEKKLAVEFTIVGDISPPSDWKANPLVTFYGELTDEQQLQGIYKAADVILITSEREGFPMAIMEGMAQGVIPISTPVGDIPKHIRSAATGYLTTSIDPAIVVKEMVDYISVLLDQNERRLQLNKEVYEYAKMHFSIEKFSEAYRGLLVAR